jgi:hypothetical protein
MYFLTSLYVAALFFVLTPGVLLSLPKGGSKLTVAAVHALVFALVLHFTYGYVKRLARRYEGFEAEMMMMKKEEEKKM